MAWGTHCPHCKQKYQKAFIDEAKRLKLTRLKIGQARAIMEGRHIGRPRKLDFDLVKKMRSEGMTIRAIAKELGCSPSSVNEIIRK